MTSYNDLGSQKFYKKNSWAAYKISSLLQIPRIIVTKYSLLLWKSIFIWYNSAASIPVICPAIYVTSREPIRHLC